MFVSALTSLAEAPPLRADDLKLAPPSRELCGKLHAPDCDIFEPGRLIGESKLGEPGAFKRLEWREPALRALCRGDCDGVGLLDVFPVGARFWREIILNLDTDQCLNRRGNKDILPLGTQEARHYSNNKNLSHHIFALSAVSSARESNMTPPKREGQEACFWHKEKSSTRNGQERSVTRFRHFLHSLLLLRLLLAAAGLPDFFFGCSGT